MQDTEGRNDSEGIVANKNIVVKWRGSDITFVTALALLALIATVITIFVFNYSFYNPERAAQRGSMGDFIGGVLNPILTFLSFTGVLISILLQRFDFSLSRTELQRSADALESQISSIDAQIFEASFFQMISSFNSIVQSIDLTNKENGGITSGRDCFRVFYTRLNKIYRENLKKSEGKHSLESVLNLSYYQFWKEHNLELGHYFRTLYNIFRFIDENPKRRPYHSKLLRAQLSDQELLLLFYNCTSKHGGNFVKYAVKYEIFDNLPTVRLLDYNHIRLIEGSAFGKNPLYSPKNIGSSF